MALEINAVISTLSHFEILFYLLTGVALASGMLFYIRTYSVNRKYRLLCLVLFIASAIYVVFALTTLNEIWIAVEVVGLLLFLLFIWMAFHYSMWFVVMGWVTHIVWDVGVHPEEIAPYVPYWYAWICVGFDAVVAVYLAFMLTRHD